MSLHFEIESDFSNYDKVSVAEGIEIARLYEDSGFESSFRRVESADISSPIAAAGAAAAAILFANPVIKVDPEPEGVTHVQETIMAAQIIQPQADLSGQKWAVSEKLTTDRFSSGQQNLQDKNTAKLENSKDAVDANKATHQQLMGAAKDLRVNQYTAKNGAAETKTTDPSTTVDTNKGPSAMSVALGAGFGWGATAVATAMMPAAAPFIQLASTAMTGAQSMALFNAATGTAGSINYDAQRKPKSKAEAAELKDSASQASKSGNAYDNTTSGGAIAAPTAASKNKMDFGAAAGRTKEDELDTFRSKQIAMIEMAAAKVWDKGVEQSLQVDDAEEADVSHAEYLDSGGTEFDTHELLRAAENGAASEVQEAGLQKSLEVARFGHEDVAAKMQKVFGDIDLSFGLTPSTPTANFRPI